MIATPELDKLKLISDKSQAIGDFLEWSRMTLCAPHHHDKSEDVCYENGTHRSPTCGFYEGEMVPTNRGIISLLAEYFDIDQQKCEDEKRALLDELRSQHKWPSNTSCHEGPRRRPVARRESQSR